MKSEPVQEISAGHIKALYLDITSYSGFLNINTD